MEYTKELKKSIDADGMGKDENILSLYLKEINNIPLMAREEEEVSARLAAQGDAAAKNKLVNANLRFVVNVAKKYQGLGLPLPDLISEGNIGLMTAIEHYDVNKGYHFISYAVWWIRQAILKAVYEKARMIRLPLNRMNELVRIEQASKLLNSGYTNEIGEISRMLKMDSSHVEQLVNISKDLVSLENPVFTEANSSQLGDYIADDNYETPDKIAEESALRDDIEALLSTLNEREAEILRYRFGLDNHVALSLQEIGERFNLTKERIRQIEKDALKTLRHPSRRHLLECYVAS